MGPGLLTGPAYTAELADDLDQTVHTSSRAGLARRELAARGVDRHAVLGDRLSQKALQPSLRNQAKVLQLHHRHHRIVVIDGDQIDLLRANAGLRV